ncbi:hypothetical protein MLD38_020667 [Melastoma candidum]|uniref:Uncharacterized protein n=1 Tax=Melastoma candidum TaxID=119954 RepID=A0ACB9QGT7_9MYRT|nr:hypothetical protein MLD38_020667 [Melastoma candidum]
MFPARRPEDYGYPVPSVAYAYDYPQPRRATVGDVWRSPSINDRHDAMYDYGYKESKHKKVKADFPEFSLKDEIGKVGGRMIMNEITGSYGHKKDNEFGGKHGASSMGYVGSMARASNEIGTAVELLKDAASQVSGGGGKPSSRMGELESLVNYYPTMHTTMDATKRYGSFSLAPRRSSLEDPNKYY